MTTIILINSNRLSVKEIGDEVTFIALGFLVNPSFIKQVHPHRITKVFLSTKTKQHTGNLVELKRAGKITIFLKLLLHSQLNQPFTMLFFD